MKKLDLMGWAAISEIVGTIAVVISLIFVAVSINRNTVQLQASNDNFLIQLQDEDFRDLSIDPNLASIIVRFARQEELTDVETMRYQMYMGRYLNRWEVAYARYEQGLIGLDDWKAWDAAFAVGFADKYPQQWWSKWRHGFTSNFASHVDAVYASK